MHGGSVNRNKKVCGKKKKKNFVVISAEFCIKNNRNRTEKGLLTAAGCSTRANYTIHTFFIIITVKFSFAYCPLRANHYTYTASYKGLTTIEPL